MTYYDELGLSPDAASKDIRKAYKRLIVFFHPDQQVDPEMQAVAEIQMKRVNEMVAILMDPEKRRCYDEGLLASAPPASQASWTHVREWIRDHHGWAGVSAACLLALMLLLAVPGKPSRPVAPVEAQVPRLARDTTESPSIRASAGALREARAPAFGGRNRKKRDSGPPAAPESEPIFTTGPIFTKGELSRTSVDARLPAERPSGTPARPRSLPDEPTPLVQAQPNPRAEPSLAGHWVYTPDPAQSRDPRLFPADYVELRIAISGGTLRGVYRSRYKIPDRAMTPVVNFAFEGPAGGNSFTWKGASGAVGQVNLEMRSSETLYVSWFATAMGSTLSLGSGTATLFRF